MTPNRAFTAYSRFPKTSIVVGTEKSVSDSRVTTRPDAIVESAITATWLFWFWTT